MQDNTDGKKERKKERLHLFYKGRDYKQHCLISTMDKTETPTCSDVKATSLGIAAIPFSLTSGNILKRAINIAYMLDMAPPGVHSNILLLLLFTMALLKYTNFTFHTSFLKQRHG